MDGVPEILADMKKAKIKANIITYSTMLKGHCQTGDIAAAFQLVKEMREEARGLKRSQERMRSDLIKRYKKSGWTRARRDHVTFISLYIRFRVKSEVQLASGWLCSKLYGGGWPACA